MVCESKHAKNRKYNGVLGGSDVAVKADFFCHGHLRSTLKAADQSVVNANHYDPQIQISQDTVLVKNNHVTLQGKVGHCRCIHKTWSENLNIVHLQVHLQGFAKQHLP